jgi:hypothetical protein
VQTQIQWRKSGKLTASRNSRKVVAELDRFADRGESGSCETRTFGFRARLILNAAGFWLEMRIWE